MYTPGILHHTTAPVWGVHTSDMGPQGVHDPGMAKVPGFRGVVVHLISSHVFKQNYLYDYLRVEI